MFKKLVLLAATLFMISTAYADSNTPVEQQTVEPPYQEMYVAFPDQARVVITNAPCLKFTKEHVGVEQLNYAYAIKLDTREIVTGCFTHHGDVIEIELVEEDDPKTKEDESKQFYHYNIKADNFVLADTPFVSHK